MAFPVHTKRIGAHTYTITQLNAVTGRKALLRLAKIFGPALDEKKGLAGVVEGLSEDHLDYFCNLFAAQTSVRGGEYADNAEPQLDKIFSEHFASDYLAMFEWLTWAVEVNFGSFFLGLAKKLSEERGKKQRVSTSSISPPTSTSGSGG